MKNSFIVGVGEIDPKPIPARSALTIAAAVSVGALLDAGMDLRQVDTVLTGYSLVEPVPMFADALAEYLGMEPTMATTINSGGATGAALVRLADATIKAGLSENVLVAWADNRSSGSMTSAMQERLRDFAHAEFELPYGATLPALYALIAQRYLYESGATPEDLAAIAVVLRSHARLNPTALRKEQLTVEDVIRSRVIATPLHREDCCLISDFGGALVISASPHGPNHPAVAVSGTAELHEHEHIHQAQGLLDGLAGRAGLVALESAGLGIDKLDFVQLYDSFTITVALQVEDLGLSGRGQAGADFRAGRYSLGGPLPVNTNGGMLSGYSGGIHHVTEAVLQLQGRAGRRQVADARFGLVTGIGGVMSSHSALVLERSGR